MSFKFAKKSVFLAVVCLIFLSAGAFSVLAQTEAEVKDAMVKGLTLFKEQRYVEAVPHLELLIKALPDDSQLRFIYGFSLVAKSKQISDAEAAKKLSAQALEQFRTAKKLGLNDEANETFIRLLSGEGGVGNANSYSKNPEAEKMMHQAEGYFARSEYDDAFKLYEKALSLDPNIYEAALFAGDVFVQKKDWATAEKWYQRAISINPARETAYRFSATPFMKQEKYNEARDRYIEAFITEPYSQMSPRGISQWAQITGAKLGHPKVDIPEIKIDASGKATTVMNENTLTESSKAWLVYSLTRENWRREKFAKSYPGEKIYRHTLQEEVDALRGALKSAKEQNLVNPQFDVLQKLDSEGLLESYILMAQPDEGIAQDHEAYLKTNRAKLRQYVLSYVIHK